VEQSATACSTCLAYFGTYEIHRDVLVHRIEIRRIAASLFPNWTDTVQERLFRLHGYELVLRTPPSEEVEMTVMHELSWEREAPTQ
jgi:hypothetical protein